MLDKITGYYQRKKRKKINNALIKDGILKVGNNCDISNLDILVATELLRGGENVIIGDDCILNCKIVLYNTMSKIIIGNRVYIGPSTTLFCNHSITIENDILLSWGITLIDTNAHSLNFNDRKNDVIDWGKGKKDWSNVLSAPILIKSKSWIGFNSIIVKGVIIGEEAIVACGSVVVKNVENKTMVGGNPAAVIKYAETK